MFKITLSEVSAAMLRGFRPHQTFDFRKKAQPKRNKPGNPYYLERHTARKTGRLDKPRTPLSTSGGGVTGYESRQAERRKEALEAKTRRQNYKRLQREQTPKGHGLSLYY